MTGSRSVSGASGKTSSSAEILRSDSKEGIFSMGKEAEVREVSASQVAG